MSDVRPGPAWWQGVDGRWYPPEQRPVGWPPTAGAPTVPPAPGMAPAPTAPLPAAMAIVATGPPPADTASPGDRRPRATGYAVAAAVGFGGLLVAFVLFVASLFAGGTDPSRTHLIPVPGERQVQLAPGPIVFFADPDVAADPPTIAVTGPNGDEAVSRVAPDSDAHLSDDGRELAAVATMSPSVSGTYRVTVTGAATEHPLVLAPSILADTGLVWTLLAMALGVVVVLVAIVLAVVTAVRRATWRAGRADATGAGEGTAGGPEGTVVGRS